MNYRLAPALLFLAMAPAAHAYDITDETPARAITITKDEDPRVIVMPQVTTMAQCREVMKQNEEELRPTADFLLCVPADMTAEGSVSLDLPYTDLNQ